MSISKLSKLVEDQSDWYSGKPGTYIMYRGSSEKQIKRDAYGATFAARDPSLASQYIPDKGEISPKDTPGIFKLRVKLDRPLVVTGPVKSRLDLISREDPEALTLSNKQAKKRSKFLDASTQSDPYYSGYSAAYISTPVSSFLKRNKIDALITSDEGTKADKVYDTAVITDPNAIKSWKKIPHTSLKTTPIDEGPGYVKYKGRNALIEDAAKTGMRATTRFGNIGGLLSLAAMTGLDILNRKYPIDRE